MLGLSSAKPAGSGLYITDYVSRGPFQISLAVQGQLDSRKNATLASLVEGTTTIIYLIPEGTQVKAGDLVCELDSSQLNEKSNTQEITVTQAEAALIQSREALEIQRNQNDSDIAAAELKWKLAQLDLVKYKEGEYPQQLKQLEGTVILNKEELVRAQENQSFIREQVKKGYRNQNDLESARLSVQQAELKLQGAEEELKVLKNFTYQRTIAELEANAAELERELERVKLKANSALAQAQKDVEARQLTAKVERDRYERILSQIKACKLYAPQDGEVVYANLNTGSRRGNEPNAIEEGATVRERQPIINLPDVTDMKVACRIHESLIGPIRAKLPARIRVDAYPDETFQGEVFQVSSVPMTGSWPNTDLREYATEIRLTDSVERIRKLRPGLTTQVEIQIDSRENVLQVPVQAVIGVSDKQICYVLKKDGTPQRREIKVGATNQTHIEVLDGLEAGEQVILNPRNRFSDEISKLESEWNAQRTRENPAAANPDGLAQPAPGATAPAGGRGPGGGPEAASAPGGGPPNPEAIFARLDKDSDGKISKAEAPEQMLDRFADLDKDGDGSLSFEEFKTGMGSGRPGGGRPPGGPGAPG